VCHWASEALVDGGRYTPLRNVEYVVAFVQKHRQYFEHAKCVLVERQMRVNMRIIEAQAVRKAQGIARRVTQAVTQAGNHTCIELSSAR
jgi:hypothetical protein